MRAFEPDYTHIVDAAGNRRPRRLPLYEHGINTAVIEAILGKPFAHLAEGNRSDRVEYFRIFCRFCADHGYDVIPFEGLITDFIQGAEGLCGRAPSLIRSAADLEVFPWDEIPDRFFAAYGPLYEALAEALPPGMKAVGGVGNGLFEIVQDFVPLTELAYLQVDDPETWERLWGKVGDLMDAIWSRFLARHADAFAVLRFGDDLGFRSSTLINPDDIRTYIIPQYRKIVRRVHEYGRPFLLHSCGSIFSVMDDIIEGTGIDAKHSNEDAIAPFSEWVSRYGDRIGLFGGVEMNVICLEDERTIREYVKEVCGLSSSTAGIAIGSGNQITSYTPPAGFLAMVEAVREFRGE